MGIPGGGNTESILGSRELDFVEPPLSASLLQTFTIREEKRRIKDNGPGNGRGEIDEYRKGRKEGYNASPVTVAWIPIKVEELWWDNQNQQSTIKGSEKEKGVEEGKDPESETPGKIEDHGHQGKSQQG